MGKSFLSCFITHPAYSNSLTAGTSSQLGILGSNPASIVCQICFQTGHSALQCPRLPSSASVPPDGLASSFTALSLGDGQETWYPDTGASAHMTPFDGNLVSKIPYHGSTKIMVADGTKLPVNQAGRCYIPTSSCPLCLNSVFHVPSLKQNLISIKRLCRDNNCQVLFDDTSVSIQDKTTGTVLLRVASNGDLYPIHIPSSSPSLLGNFSVVQPAQVWHRRLGHPSS